jgi:hypothetical protein
VAQPKVARHAPPSGFSVLSLADRRDAVLRSSPCGNGIWLSAPFRPVESSFALAELVGDL